MVLDFINETLGDMPYDQDKLKETLAWLNFMLCNKKKEVKTLQDAMFYIEKLIEKK